MAAPKVLMLTNVERGRADIFLAVSRALLIASPNLEIHFASFLGLEPEVAAISAGVRQANPANINPIIYHTIKGSSMKEGIEELSGMKFNLASDGNPIWEQPSMPLSFSISKQYAHHIAPIVVPYTGPQLVEVYTSITGIIRQVNPDIVVVDSLMTAGLTACWHINVKFTALCPNSLKDHAGLLQPRGANLWKYPA